MQVEMPKHCRRPPHARDGDPGGSGLTVRQREVHQFMLDRQRTHGSPPTIREMADTFNFISPNGVMCHIRALVKKGWVRKGAEFSARLYLAVDPTKPTACPCCGHTPQEGEA